MNLDSNLLQPHRLSVTGSSTESWVRNGFVEARDGAVAEFEGCGFALVGKLLSTGELVSGLVGDCESGSHHDPCQVADVDAKVVDFDLLLDHVVGGVCRQSGDTTSQ